MATFRRSFRDRITTSFVSSSRYDDRTLAGPQEANLMTTSVSDISLEELFEQTNAHPKTGIVYIRVSSLREKRKQEGEITVETQEDYCKSFAAREGIKIVGVVRDPNVSGRRDKFLSRRVLPTIERISAGEADCVIVYNLSRWGRSVTENMMSEAALWEAGGRLLSATEPNDERTTSGKLTRQQLYMMAEYQSNLIGDSWRATHRNRLKKQLPRDGRARFGYTYTRHGVGSAEYNIDPVTGPILADAYRRAIRGESMHSITKKLRSQGMTLPNDPTKPMTYMVLRNALDSGFGAGKIVTNTKGGRRRYLPGAQQPVITPEEWTAYEAIRAKGKVTGRPPRPKIALQGLVRCGGCKGVMHVEHLDSGDRYKCTRNQSAKISSCPLCPSPTGVRAAIVDRAVQNWLRGFLMDTDRLDQIKIERAVAARSASVNVEELEKKLAGLKSARKNYLRLRATDVIETDEELQDLLIEIDAEITDVDRLINEGNRTASMHRLPEMDLFEATLSGWLSGMDSAIVNRGLAKAIQAVYIGKGRRTEAGNGKIDIIGAWENREPQVFLAAVRDVDHNVGKHCSKCLEFKTAEQFYRRTSGRDAGKLSSWCRSCQSTYYREEWTPGGKQVVLASGKDRRTVYEHGHRRGDKARTKDGVIWTRGTKLWHQDGRPKQTKNGRTWDELNEQFGPPKLIRQ